MLLLPSISHVLCTDDDVGNHGSTHFRLRLCRPQLSYVRELLQELLRLQLRVNNGLHLGPEDGSSVFGAERRFVYECHHFGFALCGRAAAGSGIPPVVASSFQFAPSLLVVVVVVGIGASLQGEQLRLRRHPWTRQSACWPRRALQASWYRKEDFPGKTFSLSAPVAIRLAHSILQ